MSLKASIVWEKLLTRYAALEGLSVQLEYYIDTQDIVDTFIILCRLQLAGKIYGRDEI